MSVSTCALSSPLRVRSDSLPLQHLIQLSVFQQLRAELPQAQRYVPEHVQQEHLVLKLRPQSGYGREMRLRNKDM